jgi:outer membrane protein OmpA-like peptidoglycan-associated protein
MSAAGGSEPPLHQLRALLFGEDIKRLEQVETRVDKVDAYVGDRERLASATKDVLIDALREGEETRRKELSSAMAPLVIGAIRSEIKNSKDMLVEALYPITGRLVTAAVSASFRDLIETLNQRLDALTSANAWRLRLRSWLTGRSMAEIALAESDAAHLKRALLLERGSGLVVAVWPQGASERDELTSGLIAAITEFAATVYADRGGELRRLDLGASQVFLRASARLIVAADFAGELSAKRERRLDEAFLTIVERREHEAEGFSAQFMGETLSAALVEPLSGARSRRPVKIAALIAVILAAVAAFGPARRAFREHRIRAAYEAALAARPELAGFPLRLDIDHAAGRVTLRGLAPDDLAAAAVSQALQGPSEPYVASREISVPVLSVEAPADGLRAGAEIGALRERLAAAEAALAQIRAERDAPAARLSRHVDAFAVFFDVQDDIVDPGAAEAGLDELARLLKDSGAALRVVGYADDPGGLAGNIATSRKRAEKIAAMLVARGVARERLAVAPRAALEPIADTARGSRRSRRVSFERPFAHEFDRP